MTQAIRGSTRVAGIIGDPVTHSRSPAIHNAAFRAVGLDWVYVAFPVAIGAGEEAVRAGRVLGLAGLNVTMPHKAAAASACDELSDRAATLGVANTIVYRPDGTVAGDVTDGEGFVRALAEQGVDTAGRRVLVIGAGGAARAITLALADAGAGVTVSARRADAALEVATLVNTATGRDVAVASFTALDASVGGADVVVNATPLGMNGEPPPFDPSFLGPTTFVADTVYHPEETPLLAAARAHDAPCINGLGMLVHQAALAFEAWTGIQAPLEVMWTAARADGET